MGRYTAGLAWLGVISYALGACGGDSTDGSVAGGGAAGTGAVGGGGTGGIGGSSTGGAGGATGGTGGATSPGSVKLVFEVPASKSYCVSTDTCSQTSSIAIKDGSGKVLARWAGDCYFDCVVCEQLPCPGVACMPDAKAVTGETLDWNGGYWDDSTCGAAKVCMAHYFAKPGKYTATMCATPGTITTEDAYGSKQCTATGPAECVDVPFDFPSTQTFTGKLPG